MTLVVAGTNDSKFCKITVLTDVPFVSALNNTAETPVRLIVIMFTVWTGVKLQIAAHRVG